MIYRNNGTNAGLTRLCFRFPISFKVMDGVLNVDVIDKATMNNLQFAFIGKIFLCNISDFL